jgi:hypothetical protein
MVEAVKLTVEAGPAYNGTGGFFAEEAAFIFE